jgi:hypothetical protein
VHSPRSIFAINEEVLVKVELVNHVVKSTETESLVRLADFMDRLYQLEDIYRVRKRKQEGIEPVLR